MRDTSILSYRIVVDDGSQLNRQEMVLEALRVLGCATDLEIAFHLGVGDPNVVRPRRKELLDDGRIVLVEKRRCSVSNRVAMVWMVNPNPAVPVKKLSFMVCDRCGGSGIIKEQLVLDNYK